MNTPTTAHDFSKTVFIMGDFPAFSQTFILRELKEFERRGIALRVIADKETPNKNMEPWLEALKQRTTYISTIRSVCLGTSRSILKPRRLTAALRWALSLPHKSAYHRARFLTALMIAFNIAPQVKKQYTYIHAHFAAFQTELAMCLSHLTGIPWGATWHAYGIWKDQNILTEKIAGAKTIMTCTKFNVQHLKQLAPAHGDKIHLVYHGLAIDEHHSPSPVPNDPVPRFIAVGRLIPKKGFNYLIDAMSLLKQQNVPCHLTIIGDGSEANALEKQIASLGLQMMVTLAGQRPSEEVLHSLQAARGLVAPSIRAEDGDIDGIPNVLLEAMIAGRPVVGTRMSGIPEVIAHCENGYLIEPKDAPAIAESMQKLCESPTLAQSMGAAGRRFIEEHFNVVRSVDQQIDILGQLSI